MCHKILTTQNIEIQHKTHYRLKYYFWLIMNIMFNMILEFALFLLVGQNFKDFDLCGNWTDCVILSAAKYLCLSTARETSRKTKRSAKINQAKDINVLLPDWYVIWCCPVFVFICSGTLKCMTIQHCTPRRWDVFHLSYNKVYNSSL